MYTTQPPLVVLVILNLLPGIELLASVLVSDESIVAENLFSSVSVVPKLVDGSNVEPKSNEKNSERQQNKKIQ